MRQWNYKTLGTSIFLNVPSFSELRMIKNKGCNGVLTPSLEKQLFDLMKIKQNFIGEVS